MSVYTDHDLTYDRFIDRTQIGAKQPARSYVVRYRGTTLGVIVPCLLVRSYKTRGPKYYAGFEGFDTAGKTHVSRTRRFLAEHLRDSSTGRAVFAW